MHVICEEYELHHQTTNIYNFSTLKLTMTYDYDMTWLPWNKHK